ncbi:MAG: hypothetical protein KKI06_11940 [Euryarchaeota archaeon]|nr:hypothetical protein [Euryarchaeota archaeon]
MSILDVTEDDIFRTLGKGRDPNFKQIEKVRPVTYAPKKTYVPPLPVKAQVIPEPVKYLPSPEVEEAIKKLNEELSQMNKSVGGIKTMIKLYIFMFVLMLIIFVGLLGLYIKYYKP